MDFYHVLFAKRYGFNGKLTWYGNLFAKAIGGALSKIAKFISIKGNTLVWNQLVQNGNFESSSVWTGNNASVSIANNKCNVTVTVAHNSSALRNVAVNGISGHKYLGIMTVTSPKATACAFHLSGYSSNAVPVSANARTVVYGIVTPTSNTGGSYFYINRNAQLSVDDTVVVENVMFIDLTQMGLDSITDPSEFASLFGYPYYQYNTGSLLSFNGTGIKTTGKNLLELNVQSEDVTIAGIRYVHNADGTISVSGTATGTSTYRIFSSTSASRFSGMYLQGNPVNNNAVAMMGFQENGGNWTSYGYEYGLGVKLKDIPEGTNVWMFIRIFQGYTVNAVFKPMICVNNNESFEPYQEQTTSLPISTYFPTGMKSAGSVYDELTETKATTRVGEVDVPISSPNWQVHSSGRFYLNNWMPSNIPSNRNANLTNNKGLAIEDLQNTYGSYMWFGSQGLYINRISSTETIAEMQTRVSGLKLYYELATPTETEITPPLELSYNIDKGGTEQLLPENGSVPTTAPIRADIKYPDGLRTDQIFTYRVYESRTALTNRALSIVMGKSVSSEEAKTALDIITKGE